MNKKLLMIGITLCLIITSLSAQDENYSSQITQLTTKILAKTNHLENLKIGTINFTNINNETTALGKLLAEEVSGELSLQESNLTIIDRSRVTYWLNKENVNITDLSNPTIAERISRKAMIDLVLMGNITPLENACRLNLKIVNLKTGEIVAYERGNVSLDETLLSLMLKPVLPTISKEIPKEKLTSKSGKVYHDYTEVPKKIEATPKSKINTKNASALPHKTEINNLEFELRACKRLGNMVTVFFTLTNKSGDITLKIDDNDVIIHAPEFEQLALDNFRFNDDISIYVERTLTTGVPVQVQLIFNNVPSDAKTIEKLAIDYYAGRNEQIEIENIRIE